MAVSSAKQVLSADVLRARMVVLEHPKSVHGTLKDLDAGIECDLFCNCMSAGISCTITYRTQMQGRLAERARSFATGLCLGATQRCGTGSRGAPLRFRFHGWGCLSVSGGDRASQNRRLRDRERT